MYLYVYVLKESIIKKNRLRKKELLAKIVIGHMFQQKKEC